MSRTQLPELSHRHERADQQPARSSAFEAASVRLYDNVIALEKQAGSAIGHSAEAVMKAGGQLGRNMETGTKRAASEILAHVGKRQVEDTMHGAVYVVAAAALGAAAVAESPVIIGAGLAIGTTTLMANAGSAFDRPIEEIADRLKR